MPEKVLKTIKPREYQQRIYETCKDKNCLVVLPTGMGKTLIALMLTINRQRLFPGTKTLFLAPTKPLATQHLNYFKKHLPELFAELTLFTGKVDADKRKKIWERADIIFSTPQCLENDIKNNLYDLTDTALLIIDECHRCLKNYSYTYVAEKYQQQAKNPRILGLTASPGADKKTILQIAKNLGIEAIEVRTRESEDVSPYIQKLHFDIIKLDFPEELKEVRDLLKELHDRKIEELKNRKLLFQPATKKNILELQKKIMIMISTGNRNFNILAGASACAQAVKLQYMLELLETQTLSSLQRYFKDIFEQAAQNKSKAVKQLIKQPNFNQAYIKTTELLARKIENPKLSKLKEIVENEFKTAKIKRIIVFAQYRETLVKICKSLNEILGVNARVFVGQAKKGTGKDATGLSQKEQQEILRDFSLGKINILCASSIGEEGLDIVEVSAVIFYEPIPSAIRKIQRCVPKDSKILMESGECKPISLVSKGEMVISYNYEKNIVEPKRVIEVFENNSKELLEITTKKGNKIKLTENHPILTPRGWLNAKNLTNSDYIAIAHSAPPKEGYCSITEFLPNKTYLCISNHLKELIKNLGLTYKEIQEILHNKGCKINKKTLWGYANRDAIPIEVFKEILDINNIKIKDSPHIKIVKSRKGNRIDISKITLQELMWLAGIIASDGDLRRQSKIRKNRKIPYFTYRFRVCNSNQEILTKAANILKRLGLKIYKDREDVISSNNTIIGKILNNLGIPLGKKSKTIELSNQLFMSCPKAIKSFLAGLFDGDGNYNKGPCQIRLGTASKNFAFQLQALLLKIGIISKVCIFDKTESRIIKGRLVNFIGNFYSVEIYKKRDVAKFLNNKEIVKVKDKKIRLSYSKDSNFEKNIFWAKISSIRKRKKEKTFNLRVMDNDSYVVDNIILHNCGRTARLKPGKLIILMNKKTIDEAYYWAAFHKEKKMYSALNGIKEEMENGKLNLNRGNNNKETEGKENSEDKSKEKQERLF